MNTHLEKLIYQCELTWGGQPVEDTEHILMSEIVMMGFWICHAVESEEDNEWIMNLATCRTPFELFIAIEKIGIESEHFSNSLTYLIYGTTDADVIASLTKSGEEE